MWTEDQAALAESAYRAPAGYAGTKRPLQHAIINVSVAGNTDLIPITAGYLIEIWEIVLWNAAVDQTIRFLDGDRLLLRLTNCPAGSGFPLYQNAAEPHFRIEENSPLRINLTDTGNGIGQVDGFVNYRKIVR